MSEKEFSQFAYRWIQDLLASMEAHVEAETLVTIMEDCGRGCARATALPVAERHRGDLDGWLAGLGGAIGATNIQADAALRRVQITYPQCFCHLVSDGPARLSDTYCHCSCGWLKELFELVLESPVEVTLSESIKRGGDACRFTVTW
jgi:hypothetical protein